MTRLARSRSTMEDSESHIESQGGSVAVALVSNTGETFLREKESRRLFGVFYGLSGQKKQLSPVIS